MITETEILTTDEKLIVNSALQDLFDECLNFISVSSFE